MMYMLKTTAKMMKERYDERNTFYSGYLGGFYFNLVRGYGDGDKPSLEIAQNRREMIQRVILIPNIDVIEIDGNDMLIHSEQDIMVRIPIYDDPPEKYADMGIAEIRCPKCNKKINMKKVKTFEMTKTDGLSCTYDIRCPSCDTELKYTEKMMCVKKDIEVKE